MFKSMCCVKLLIYLENSSVITPTGSRRGDRLILSLKGIKGRRREGRRRAQHDSPLPSLLTFAKTVIVEHWRKVPLQPLLQKSQMLFQPPDLLPLDPGCLPVPVHVPDKTKTHQRCSSFTYLGLIVIYCRDKLLVPVHVEHGGELQLVVDLLRSSQSLVELKP